jgi:hypothetical protein
MKQIVVNRGQKLGQSLRGTLSSFVCIIVAVLKYSKATINEYRHFHILKIQ